MALGSFLALDGVNILVVFYVFNPALVSSNLSRTITYQRNLGNMLLIIVLALCKEKGSPFGDLDVCHIYGLAYASLSMAVGAIYLWSYVYNLVQIYSRSFVDSTAIKDIPINEYQSTKPLLSSLQSAQARNDQDPYKLPFTVSEVKAQVGTTQHLGIMHHLGKLFKKLNLKALFAPSTTAVIAGFAIGIIPQIRNSLIGSSTPLRVLQDTSSLLGYNYHVCPLKAIILLSLGDIIFGLIGMVISSFLYLLCWIYISDFVYCKTIYVLLISFFNTRIGLLYVFVRCFMCYLSYTITP
ncbi:hypothetical protein UlMin_012181 [Ulmus minor]